MAIFFLLILLAPFAAYGSISFCSSDACGGITTENTAVVWVASQSSSSSYCGDSGFALLCLCPAIASTASLTFLSDSTSQFTSNGDSLNFYFNCSYGLSGSYSQIPCLPDTSINGSYSIFTKNSTHIDYNSAAICAGTARGGGGYTAGVARMIRNTEGGGGGGGTAAGDAIGAGLSAGTPVLIEASDGVLVRGYQLGWSSSAQDSAACAACEGSGGVCRYNQTAAGSLMFSCFCSSSNGFRPTAAVSLPSPSQLINYLPLAPGLLFFEWSLQPSPTSHHIT
uniref:Wall-associated receptor kinase C-terminal domain-containing protein n=1 Tax=Ananas comosus var. bracteatus TaxID=296719 RepID=A0A6V7PV03_ANACO|nr:unnamed protein product [Ananas comosus var. bracteatus]